MPILSHKLTAIVCANIISIMESVVVDFDDHGLLYCIMSLSLTRNGVLRDMKFMFQSEPSLKHFLLSNIANS